MVGKGRFEPDASADVCSRPCRIGKGSFRGNVEPSAYANVRRLGCQLRVWREGVLEPRDRTADTGRLSHVRSTRECGRGYRSPTPRRSTVFDGPSTIAEPVTSGYVFLQRRAKTTKLGRTNRSVVDRPFRPRRRRRDLGDFGSPPGCACRPGGPWHTRSLQLGDPLPEPHAPCVRSRPRQRRSDHRLEPLLRRREGDRRPLPPVAIGPVGALAHRRRRSREVRRRAPPL